MRMRAKFVAGRTLLLSIAPPELDSPDRPLSGIALRAEGEAVRRADKL